MNVRDIAKVVNRHGAIHLILALFFAFCWSTHYFARMKMNVCNRQFRLMNDKTIGSMGFIDTVHANLWIPIAYVSLVFLAVLFLQIRRWPPWTRRLTATVLCIPAFLYLDACAYISGKLIF